MATKVEQTDHGFQISLEIFNVHWYAGAANSRTSPGRGRQSGMP
jgi:hypothetical protein